MGLEDMAKKILEEADAEVKDILERSHLEAEAEKRAGCERLDLELANLRLLHERHGSDLRNQYLSEARRNERHLMLQAKEGMILEALASVKARLRDMKGPDLERFLLSMLLRTRAAIGEDLVVHPVRPMDAMLLQGHCRVAQTVPGSSSGEISARFAGRDPIGGFIAFSSDSKRVMDMTFQGILDREDERIRETISRALYSE